MPLARRVAVWRLWSLALAVASHSRREGRHGAAQRAVVTDWAQSRRRHARTALIVRGSKTRGLELVYGVALIEIPHFIMERKMLLGIKERAEAGRTGVGRRLGEGEW